MALEVASQWFETRRFTAGVTLLFEPYVIEGVRCNIWHVQGRDRDLLIDSGMGLASLAERVRELGGRPVSCVATHTHFDHVGGHHEFTERLVHRAEADILAAPDAHNTVADLYVSEGIFTAAPWPGFDPARYAVRAAPPTRLLEDGDVLDLGDRHFEVLHLPGHSPGSIALWEARTATLFSGDVVYDGPLYDHLYHSNVDHYVESMERLLRLPVETVHGGHHASFGRERLLELVNGYLQAKGKGRRRPA